MIWVSSSAVLVVVCALFLFWVVPHLHRRREARVESTGTDPAGADPATAEHSLRTEAPSPESRRRRITMATTDTVSPSTGSSAARSPGTLRIKRDRVGILLAGCAALLAALLTAAVAPFSAAVSWPWPVFLLLLGVGSVLALRYLAVQDRAARRSSRPVRAPAVDPHAPRGDVALFDNEDAVTEDAVTEEADEVRERPGVAAQELDLPAEHEQPRTPAAFTVEELRAEALRVARESAGAATRTWEPVPVPRPTYADAPVIQRAAPEPLPVPEQPASRSGSLKDAVRTGEERGRAALDLDDVLKRRRA
jgi:hypothetical protein